MIFMATASILYTAASSLHLNSRQMWTSDSFNYAESGAQVGDLWLMQQPSPPTGSDPNVPVAGTPFNATIDSGTYVVTIYPDSGNATNFLKTYRIVCVGGANGSSKKVEIVVRQSSFGRYAYFTDKETSAVTGGAIWWKAGDFVDGPVHSNNASGSNFQINYNGSNAPIFQDIVTAAGPSINYNPSAPNTEDKFKQIFLNGSKGYLLGVTPIPLPDSSSVQKNAAWGSSSGYPTGTSGVYLKAGSNGGIYIQGDAQLTLTVSGGNQVFTVKQGTSPVVTTTITLNKTTGAISTSGTMGSGSPTSATSLGTGVIYCSGNVTSLSGQVADNLVANGKITTASAFTIATDVNAGKDITITNNLTYTTRPDKTKGATDPVNLAAGTLGLVADNITVASTAPQNMEIDAVCLAGGQNTSTGSFGVANYDSKTPAGTLKVLGGIIQKQRGAVSTFNGSTGQISTGYDKDYHYDPRLATNPPPFYPTTGQYERLSWQVLAN